LRSIGSGLGSIGSSCIGEEEEEEKEGERMNVKGSKSIVEKKKK